MSMLNKYNKYTCGQIEAVLNMIGGEEVMDKLLVGAIRLVKETISYIVAIFTIAVDKTVSVEEAVKEGNFSCCNPKITSEKFPKLTDGRKSDKKIVLFHFNKRMTSEAVIIEMNKVGYKPANIWYLIGLAVKEPDLQRELVIVALGCFCWLDDDRYVPYLSGSSSGRSLDLGCLDRDWDERYHFVAVRK